MKNNARETGYLLLCLADGSIYSLAAWSGAYQSVIPTEPLLSSTATTSAGTNDNDNASGEQIESIIPSLDGRLYWRAPKNTAAADDDDDDDKANVDVFALQELPLTVADLLENPVRSCDTDNSNDCGILTAQTVTSLLALSESGDLLWKTPSGNSGKHNPAPHSDVAVEANEDGKSDAETSKAEEPPNKTPSLLLQRKDYWIQHVMAKTGKQSWNVSLGTYQALDFNLPRDDESSSSLLIDGRGLGLDDESPILPSIIFSNAGRTLTAVDPANSDHILWRQDVPSTLSSVFGIVNGQWKTVQVIQQLTSHYYDEASSREFHQQLLLPSSTDYNADYYEHFLWTLHHQQQQDYYRQQQKLSHHRQQKALPSSEHCQVTPDGVVQCGTVVPAPEPEHFVNNNKDDLVQQQQPHLLSLQFPASENLNTRADDGGGGGGAGGGIFVSWGLLNTIICGAAIVWIVYKLVRKSQRRMLTPIIEESSSSDERRTIQRSASLPGTLGTPDPYHRNKNLALLGDDRIVLKDAANNNSTTNNTNVEQAVTTSIPLVRYSRYASEFEEIQKLGKGGFGSVFECQNVLDGRSYAVKKIAIRHTKDYEMQLHRVLREVKILAMLDHANIVRYYTAWLEEQSGDHKEDDDRDGDDDETRQSAFDSDSISTWDASRNKDGWDMKIGRSSQHRSPMRRSRRASGNNAVMGKNPLGWNTTADFGDFTDRSYAPPPPHRRRNLPSTDDFRIFEDSKENYEQSDSLFDRDCPDSAIAADSSFPNTFMNPQEQSVRTTTNLAASSTVDPKATSSQSLASVVPSTHHMLYIQMQLCSEKTLTEFLLDSKARNDASGAIDFPKALRLFLQIAQAVEYVHGRGLIHRDLKPLNCFMDDDLSIKVGDFGLSRESRVDEDASTSSHQLGTGRGQHEDHTAGVGTRSYASPEQMNGSAYDASTDVYSLGIMLFELLYPMYTGMERSLCLGRLRNGKFPGDWHYSGFPSLQQLILRMLSTNPADRPSAGEAATHIESILSEFTIVSLDQRKYEKNANAVILLRVEAVHNEDTLKSTIDCIQTKDAKIVEYGLRVVNDKSIMEFAIQNTNAELIQRLQRHPSIFKVRQVSTSSISS